MPAAATVVTPRVLMAVIVAARVVVVVASFPLNFEK